MLTQTEGQMYLSTSRGITNRKTFRSFHTFNHGDYFDESRKPFGNLIACNDDTLAVGNAIITSIDKYLEILVIPIVGCIEIKDNYDRNIFLESGQAYILRLNRGEYYQISNPFKNELVNFLQIWFEKDESIIGKPNELIPFNLDAYKNELQAIGNNCHIGKYSGREEDNLTVSNNKGIFGFVIEGAFEFQNRLLEARDSIALWNEDAEAISIEFEALSNNAIILITEVKTRDGSSF